LRWKLKKPKYNHLHKILYLLTLPSKIFTTFCNPKQHASHILCD
jgi:hypothetical protein